MRRFAGVLTLGGHVDEAVRLVECALCDRNLLAGGPTRVVKSDDGLDKAAARNLEFCCGARGVGIRGLQRGELAEANGFGYRALTVVLMNGVIGDEDGQRFVHSALCGDGPRSVGLRK